MIRDSWLLVLLTILAVARLTRLVTVDVLFQPFRAFIVRHRPEPAAARDPELPEQDQDPKEDWLAYLVHCQWCCSVWIAPGVVAVVYNWPASWLVQIGLVAASASMVTGLLAGLER